MITRMVGGAVASCLALAATLLSAAPVAADADQCDTGQMCFWHDQNYQGTFFKRTSSDKDLGSHSDEAHSLYNRTSANWMVFDDKNHSTTDRRFCVRPNRRVSDLGNSSLKFGDKISSVKKLSGGCPAEVPVL